MPTKIELMDLVNITNPSGLGLRLNISESSIAIVEANHRNDYSGQLSDVFSLYLQQTEEPSWIEVVKALRAINERRCAKNIMDHFGK